MPPRKSRGAKAAAPAPAPATTRTSRSKRASKEAAPVEEVEEVDQAPEEEEAVAEAPVEAEVAVTAESTVEDAEEEKDEPAEKETVEEEEEQPEVASEEVSKASASGSSSKITTEERLAKLKDLRIRMNQSTAANRKDLVADHQKTKVTAKELARLEKQRKLAATLRLKAEAEELGEDMERRKNWEYSIEDSERWEKKMEIRKITSDSRFHNAEHDAHKRYEKNIKTTKADLLAYERQKEEALGLAPGTLVPIGASSSSILLSGRPKGLTAAEDLYRGADTLSYGDSKPSDDAIDRVVGKINKDISKGKKRKADEGDGQVTYINKANKVFNNKINRYFDKYTSEIRANFERGTAL